MFGFVEFIVDCSWVFDCFIEGIFYGFLGDVIEYYDI